MTTAKRTKWSPQVLPKLNAPVQNLLFFFYLKSTVKAFQSNMVDSTRKQGKGQGNREGISQPRTELYHRSLRL